ncbi:MAG: hypothetical protein D6704_06185 [Nitrospirae bacterium]|nr:MAG: hypothetical protein D6704_06185 [Nitrospirota bacterium]
MAVLTRGSALSRESRFSRISQLRVFSLWWEISSKLWVIILLVLLPGMGLRSAGDQKAVQAGQPIILHAQKPVGVPLHRTPQPSYWKHVPDQTPATVQQIDSQTGWIQIRLESGESAWVSPKYVRMPPSARSDRSTPPLGQAASPTVWSSPASCEHALMQGQRLDRPSTRLRIVTWNLRWFPYGHPLEGRNAHDAATDLRWLTCLLVWMQVDILAVQESLATPQADAAWSAIMQALKEQTGQRWHWYRQPCGKPDSHHVGVLWNTARVTLSRFQTLWQFNAHAQSPAEACSAGLRPGLYAWVESRKPHGVDFHLIVLHLKSGPTVAALEARHRALNRIDWVTPSLAKLDADIIILGDFNTMGAGDRRSQRYELKAFRRLVAKESPGFDTLPVSPACTHYFGGRGGRLDHVLVAKAMREVVSRAARVSGYCASTQCRRIVGDYPLAYRRLSDHCPVIVDVADRDDDG